jgi:hypothetical protein
MNKCLLSLRILYPKNVDLSMVTPTNNSIPFFSINCFLDILFVCQDFEMSYRGSLRQGVGIKSISHIVYHNITG